MKKIAFVICFLLPICVFSQTDFRKGFIVKNNGEKIYGYVDYKENATTYEYCEFKKTLESEITEYTPQQLRAYGFENDKFFQSKNISIKDSSKEIKFLEVIISGRATLFKFRGIFYLDKDKIFKELNNETILYSQGSQVYKRTSKKYIGLLKVYFKDCSSVIKNINKVQYDEKQLGKLITDYNNCKGSKSVIYKKDKPWFKISFGFNAGISYSSLAFDLDIQDELYFTSETNSRTNFNFGFYTELSSPRIFEKLSFYTGLFYLSNEFSNNKIEQLNNNINKYYEVRSKINLLSIPIGIRYEYKNLFLKPNITFGITNNINLKSYTKWKKLIDQNNTVTTYSSLFESPKITVGYFVSLGIKKKINKKLVGIVDLKYSYLNLKNNNRNINNFPASTFVSLDKYNSSISSFQLLFGINF